MSDIFLSYSSKDRDRAIKLAHALEKQGWSVFWDRTIPPGQTWRSYIGDKLNAAKCLIVAWSESSTESSWVMEEADDGKARGILVPVFFDNVPVPLGFRNVQGANLSDWDGTDTMPEFRRLIEAITDLIGSPSSKQVAHEKIPKEDQPKHTRPEMAQQAKPETEPVPEPDFDSQIKPREKEGRKSAKPAMLIFALLIIGVIAGGGVYVYLQAQKNENMSLQAKLEKMRQEEKTRALEAQRLKEEAEQARVKAEQAKRIEEERIKADAIKAAEIARQKEIAKRKAEAARKEEARKKAEAARKAREARLARERQQKEEAARKAREAQLKARAAELAKYRYLSSLKGNALFQETVINLKEYIDKSVSLTVPAIPENGANVPIKMNADIGKDTEAAIISANGCWYASLINKSKGTLASFRMRLKVGGKDRIVALTKKGSVIKAAAKPVIAGKYSACDKFRSANVLDYSAGDYRKLDQYVSRPDKAKIKFRVSRSGYKSVIKLLISHTMSDKQHIKLLGIYLNNRPVIHMSVNKYLSKNPFFDFTLNNLINVNDVIKVIWLDKQNTYGKETYKVKNILSTPTAPRLMVK